MPPALRAAANCEAGAGAGAGAADDAAAGWRLRSRGGPWFAGQAPGDRAEDEDADAAGGPARATVARSLRRRLVDGDDSLRHVARRAGDGAARPARGAQGVVDAGIA